MKKIIIILIFIFTIPLAIAFDCDYFSGQEKEDCTILQDINESLIANLIYADNNIPNHEFIENYNNKIDVNPEKIYDNYYIENAWLNFAYIYPSIIYGDKLYANTFKIRYDFNYDIEVPENYRNNDKDDGDVCKIKYYLDEHSSEVNIYKNGNYFSNDLDKEITITEETWLRVEIIFRVTIKEKIYEWDRDCDKRVDGKCVDYDWDCEYDKTKYLTDYISISRYRRIYPYTKPQSPSFKFLYEYGGNYWGNLSSYQGNLNLNIDDKHYVNNVHYFYTEFAKNEPYIGYETNEGFLQLYATDFNYTKSRGFSFDDDLLISNKKEPCEIVYYDFFEESKKDCEYDLKEIPVDEFKVHEKELDWTLILYLMVFIFMNIVIYRAIRRYWCLS